MKDRMGELWRAVELEGEPFVANEKSVLGRVNGALNAVPSERQGYMKYKMRRVVLAAAAALLLAGSALAAASQWDALSVFFQGDTAQVQAYMQSPNTVVEDENFAVTLESSVSDGRNVFLVLTVKALTVEARDQFAKPGETDLSAISCWVERPMAAGGLEQIRIGTQQFGVQEERSTEDSRSFQMQITSLPGDATRVWLEFEFLPEGKMLDIPLDHAVGTIDLAVDVTAKARDGEDYTFKGAAVSPLTFQFYYKSPGEQGALWPVYFLQMADGSICTPRQVAGPAWGQQGLEADSYMESYAFPQVRDPSDFKAVIVEGTAYPMDGSATYPVTVDPKLAPFRMPLLPGAHRNGPYLLPAQVLCGNLGAAYQWDERAQTATLSYRDITLSVTLGSKTMGMDGEVIDLDYPPVLREGALYLDPIPVFELWRLVTRMEFSGEASIPRAWIITP